MLSVEKRHDFILEELLRNGRVTIVELSRQLQVNRNTIQSDLEKLERRKLLHRVRGGPLPMERPRYTLHPHGLTFQQNMQNQIDDRARIARDAIAFIKRRDTLPFSRRSTTP